MRLRLVTILALPGAAKHVSASVAVAAQQGMCLGRKAIQHNAKDELSESEGVYSDALACASTGQ